MCLWNSNVNQIKCLGLLLILSVEAKEREQERASMFMQMVKSVNVRETIDALHGSP